LHQVPAEVFMVIRDPAIGWIDVEGFAASEDAFGRWDLWFRPCDDPGCLGRHTVVLATRMGRDRLMPAVRATEEAAARGDDDTVALEDPDVFLVHLDLGFARPFEDDTHPTHGLIAASLGGELLDQVHDRWLAVRGHPPGHQMVDPSPERVRSWVRGEMISWLEPFPHSRVDGWFDAAGEPVGLLDQYCVIPGCPCPLAVLLFVRPDDPQVEVAAIEVDYRSGREPTLRTAAERACWAGFVARHPNWRERLADRHERIRPYGEKLGAAPDRGPRLLRLGGNRRARRDARRRRPSWT
jgi:hypothetical protein